MDQLLLSGFSRLRVQPRNLLPAGMEITPYNHHCEDSFLPSVFGPQIKTTGSNRVFALIQSTSPSWIRRSWGCPTSRGSRSGYSRRRLPRPRCAWAGVSCYHNRMAKSKKFDLENPAPVIDDENEETLPAIDEGMRDAQAGRTVPAEEVRRLLPKWTTTSSTPKKR